jgi:glycosyltransferase involved in cell wall biosynthesis
MPLLSIITINMNNSAGLERTLRSIADQTFTDFEHLVIDGGSTDGSRELIQQHASRLAYWCAEPDEGVYHAMNKGIRAAKGIYLLFLNSGDHLCAPNTLQELSPCLDKRAAILYGNIRMIKPNGTGKLVRCPNTINGPFLVNYSLPHPATFIMREALIYNDMYDKTYTIAGDYDFFVKALLNHHMSYRRIPHTVANFHTDGLSSKKENKAIIRRERRRALRSAITPWHYLWLKTIAIPYRIWWVVRKMLYRW